MNGATSDRAALLKDVKPGEGPVKCTWKPNSSEPSPHTHRPSFPAELKATSILSSVLDHIGNTPMVRINKISNVEGIQCELVAKCEFFNAGGSVKDRIGLRMIEDAEKSGRIKPGDTLIEPTSGNTGIGLALAAAIKGYPVIITLPEKMSQEKVDLLRALGAEIVRTPTEAAYDSPDSHIGVAKRLNAEIKNSHILDQYINPSNPLAHYDGTAEEILQQCDYKIDAIVIAAGTGGTITGIARKFREKMPSVHIVGVDPVGSILALPDSLNGKIESYKVEGIGYDFVPAVLERPLVDEWIKSSDKESFIMARRLMRDEGLLCGGSSGAAMIAALQVAKRYQHGQRVVVLLADGIRNYMSKHLRDDWMIENEFLSRPSNFIQTTWWTDHVVSQLSLSPPLTVTPNVTCSQCVDILNAHDYDQLPCVEDSGAILGMVTLGNLTSQIVSGRVEPTDPITKCLYKQFKAIPLTTSLGKLSQIFDRDHFALVTTTQKRYESADTVSEKTMIFGIVTRIDLLNYIMNKQAPVKSGTHSPQQQKSK